MKKFLGLVTVVIAVNVAGWYLVAPLVFEAQSRPVSQTLAPQVVDVFSFTLREEVDKKIGQPIEGYEPQMFIAAFPGLTETDFEGVEASLGYYTFRGGKLELVLDESQLIHSAAGAISRTGMETLLTNVSARTGINLEGKGTLTDIMRYLIEAQ